jgi:ribosomal protein L30/L7E
LFKIFNCGYKCRNQRGYLYHKGLGVNHMNKQALLKDIEAYRIQMVSQASHTSLNNEKVVELSKKLDNLLNKYEHYIKNSGNSR